MKKQRGFSMIELMITLAIVGIIVVMAVPSFSGQISKRKVKGAAEEFYATMMRARSEAIKKSTDIRVSTAGSGTSAWSYGMTDKTSACTPTILVAAAGDASCTLDYDNDRVNTTTDLVLVRKDSTDYPNVVMTAGNNVTFSGLRATANNSGTTFSLDGFELRVVVALIGRSKLCEPTENGMGYPVCP